MKAPAVSIGGESSPIVKFSSDDSQRARAKQTGIATQVIDRLCENADVEAWMQHAFREGLKNGYWPPRPSPTGNDSIIIAVDRASDEIVGGITYFSVAGNKIWCDLVYVAPDRRQQGIGGLMLQALKADAVATKAVGIMFGTGMDNVAMQSAGKASGFQPDHVVYSIKFPAVEVGT